MKQFLIAFAILIVSFSAVNANNNKNIVICYFSDNKIVFENIKWFRVLDGGRTLIDLRGGAEVNFSGAYTCLYVEDNDELVNEFKEKYGLE